MTTLVIEELVDRVVVTLAREKQRNAIDAAMISELHEVCALVEQDPRVLILTGQGDHFAGGADINQLRERTRDDALRGINRNLFDRIAALPLPTIAAIRGYALGGGAELSYACDIRIASDTAVFGNPEPGLGIMAAAGASYRLPELVGVSVAKQVLLAGRLLDADAALSAGLVMDITDDPLSAAHALADRIVRQAPLALRLTKKILDAPGSHPWADDIAQAVLFETEDKQRRMTAFLEKRK
ncbi:enoyl-CoA hydratase/isomerase family protein [Rhodococcus sp. BP-252]|uniref:enoyl-CoA hydratase/isomerase family protein n=1 Tax=unclassified Rhodococcus (in: high G+C Gram-positive bacteria) TaxID=192944 RepID=UPI001C9B4FE6|nr:MULTISPECIES: enoyl-CoA hydratase/isomerase family protein [unclassified Rhodococcus (in: high G+C Gram-positive bacteria)]MBY6412833.1 enoyl-CoA hydratase/isomerase family protein [Rhodococcus sp. BP-320]MBY6417630.1 enoyl-CoA hydratase/isomerase family protein [Rhodococcus sp. BP-321]MBY6423482.1 enoyl-CoA hydratase/isomerase family protein [Rhodococcus sp. BP-324]MBY6427654.1 enoyl-CoA hydratase/isomerase family protein [Rhodococcus sp. BP-323]MBY6432818.1 enoyl-CoA hydratase/isomerase f